MIESNQQNAFATDDKIKSQHSELSSAHRGDLDQSRLVADKKNDNGHNSNSNGDNGNSKRPKTVCFDFKKGFCRRRFCRVSSMRMDSALQINSTNKTYSTVSACDECGPGDFLSWLSKHWLLPSKLSVSLMTAAHEIIVSCRFRNLFGFSYRFIHRNIEEEEHYRQFGVFPLPAERSAVSLQQMASEQQIPPPPAQSFYQPHIHNDEMVANVQPHQQQQLSPQQQQQPIAFQFRPEIDVGKHTVNRLNYANRNENR